MRRDDEERGDTATVERPDPWRDGFDWDADEERPHRPRRGRVLIVAGVLPWLVVGALVLRPGRAAPVDGAVPTPAAGVAASGGDGSEPTVDGAIGPSDEVTEVPDTGFSAQVFGARVSAGASDASAVAMLVARDWLETVAADLEVVDLGRTGAGGYVEHLAVESIDMPTAGGAIVTLVGIVLDVADGQYRGARPVRVAVPVAVDADGARPAGAPWWLPPPDLTVEEPAWERVDDPELMVRAGEAIALAGYRDIAVEQLERTEGWPLRVTFTAVAPGEEASATHVVWLRDHLGDLVVAGWLPGVDADGRRDAPPPAPSPTGPTTEGGR